MNKSELMRLLKADFEIVCNLLKEGSFFNSKQPYLERFTLTSLLELTVGVDFTHLLKPGFHIIATIADMETRLTCKD